MNPEIVQLKMELPYYQEIEYTANIFIPEQKLDED